MPDRRQPHPDIGRVAHGTSYGRCVPFHHPYDVPAFGQLVTSGSTPEVEKAILGSIKRCEPWVYAIWTLVLVAAFLGVVKPGSTAF